MSVERKRAVRRAFILPALTIPLSGYRFRTEQSMKTKPNTRSKRSIFNPPTKLRLKLSTSVVMTRAGIDAFTGFTSLLEHLIRMTKSAEVLKIGDGLTQAQVYELLRVNKRGISPAFVIFMSDKGDIITVQIEYQSEVLKIVCITQTNNQWILGLDKKQTKAVLKKMKEWVRVSAQYHTTSYEYLHKHILFGDVIKDHTRGVLRQAIAHGRANAKKV